MLGIVRDVSATLVATTHSRTPSGGGMKTLGAGIISAEFQAQSVTKTKFGALRIVIGDSFCLPYTVQDFSTIAC